MKLIKAACLEDDVAPSDAALRWMAHHSALSGNRGDGIIVGASKMSHVASNLKALVKGGPLPPKVVAAFEDGWKIVNDAKAVPSFSRGYSGSDL